MKFFLVILIIIGFIISNIPYKKGIMLIGNALIALGIGLWNPESFASLMGIGLIIAGVLNISLIQIIHTRFGDFERNSSCRIIGIIELITGFIMYLRFAG